jgi:hypothetical protein
MFRIIEFYGHVPIEAFDQAIFQSCLIEYRNELQLTFIYVFNPFNLKTILKNINQVNQHYRVHNGIYHAAFQAKLHYQAGEIQDQGVPLLQACSALPGVNHQLFIEINKRRKRIKVILTYTSINDLQQQLKDYELKYVVPFYYLREMKEYQKEKKIKIDQLTLGYTFEYKALQGLKR